jgi:ParB family chromosome partitioning protein
MSVSRGLGKGLSVLLGEKVTIVAGESLVNIAVDQIDPGPYQPRRIFDNESLYELADSINKNGLIQPIVVVKNNDRFSLIAGERRWRASKIAGLEMISVIIKELKTPEMLEYALIENIQRENLNVIEEAEGYLRLMGEFGYTQEELSNVVNKSRSHVANILRLNTLPEAIKNKLLNGDLSMGHGRALIGHTNAEEISELIVNKGLNVRQTEELVRNWDKGPSERINNGCSRFSDLDEIMNMLSEKLDVKVKIEKVGNGGKLIFCYNNPEQLDGLLDKLMRG